MSKGECDTSLQSNFKTLQAQFTLLYNEHEQSKQGLEETKHHLAQRCQSHILQLEQIEVGFPLWYYPPFRTATPFHSTTFHSRFTRPIIFAALPSAQPEFGLLSYFLI